MITPSERAQLLVDYFSRPIPPQPPVPWLDSQGTEALSIILPHLLHLLETPLTGAPPPPGLSLNISLLLTGIDIGVDFREWLAQQEHTPL